MFISSILVIGASGLIAQVLILRELLVSFYGNELTVGIILANWILCEALGAFLIGRTKKLHSIPACVSVFLVLQTVFSLSLPLSIYASRVFKGILGIPFAETVGLSAIFPVSLAVNAVAAFCHGGIFSCVCQMRYLFAGQRKGGYGVDKTVGTVYVWETIGTVLGGIALTYLCIPYFNSFQIAVTISAANLILCLSFLKYLQDKSHKAMAAVFLILLVGLAAGSNPGRIHRFSLHKQWKGSTVLDYRNSVYGNIVVTQQEKQYTFFYNGIPYITVPYPDIAFVEEFGIVPLLFSDSPHDVLVIAGGAGGLLDRILRHPVGSVDYAQLDPLVIEMVKKFPTELTQRELSDPRVKVINTDGRAYLKNTGRTYDVILLAISQPYDLAVNRIFTQEFFSLAKNKLSPKGILAFCLPGSTTYISSELRDLNSCVLGGLQRVFAYTRVIPGDYNLFLASRDKDIRSIDAAALAGRINSRGIKTDLLTPGYLAYRLDKEREAWFRDSTRNATQKINRDFIPFAVFQTMLYRNKQFSDPLTRLFEIFKRLTLPMLVIAAGIIFALVFFLSCRRKPRFPKAGLIYAVAGTGFFSMLINLVLLFAYQVFYGYVYYKIGLLISIFMAGIAAGGTAVIALSSRIKNALHFFIAAEFCILLFVLLLAGVLSCYGSVMSQSMYMIFLFISGFLTGVEFPLANRIMEEEKANIGSTVGVVYGADLLGGWLAGISGGVVLLPVVGLLGSCIFIAFLKLTNFTLLIIGNGFDSSTSRRFLFKKN